MSHQQPTFISSLTDAEQKLYFDELDNFNLPPSPVKTELVTIALHFPFGRVLISNFNCPKKTPQVKQLQISLKYVRAAYLLLNNKIYPQLAEGFPLLKSAHQNIVPIPVREHTTFYHPGLKETFWVCDGLQHERHKKKLFPDAFNRNIYVKKISYSDVDVLNLYCNKPSSRGTDFITIISPSATLDYSYGQNRAIRKTDHLCLYPIGLITSPIPQFPANTGPWNQPTVTTDTASLQHSKNPNSFSISIPCIDPQDFLPGNHPNVKELRAKYHLTLLGPLPQLVTKRTSEKSLAKNTQTYVSKARGYLATCDPKILGTSDPFIKNPFHISIDAIIEITVTTSLLGGSPSAIFRFYSNHTQNTQNVAHNGTPSLPAFSFLSGGNIAAKQIPEYELAEHKDIFFTETLLPFQPHFSVV